MKNHTNKNNLIFLILTIIFFTSCKYQDVEIIDIKDIKLGKINTKEINLNAVIEINNPNNSKIKISKYEFDIKINGQSFQLSEEYADIKIPKRFKGSILISFKLTKIEQGIFSLSSLLSFSKIIAKRSANIEVQGYVKAGIFLVSKKIPVDEKRSVKF